MQTLGHQHLNLNRICHERHAPLAQRPFLHLNLLTENFRLESGVKLNLAVQNTHISRGARVSLVLNR